jgi:hypothetical protein
MSELDEDESWYTSENLDDDNTESNETCGEQSMDRLAIYLGPAIVLPQAFALIPTYLASPEWQKRHAALRCISAIGEGCIKSMKNELDKIIELVIPHLRDPHPRVRHAACNAIGQMCTDFAPTIQSKFHAKIVPALISVLDDSKFLRVQTYGAAALVNFSESAKRDSIAPYLSSIIPKLLLLMNTGVIYSQEQAITTLATVADTAGSEFSQYYPGIMPVLMNFLRMPNQKELRALRGKTMECASLVALSVGKDIFIPHANEFINLLRETQMGITDPDDPQSSYLLSAWARVCKVLGAEFAPYLEIILPPLLASAQLQADVKAFEPGEAIPDDYSPEEGWELIDVRGKTVGIRTSTLEDKCTAIEMLGFFIFF